MFQAIIGPVAKLASTWIEGRQKKAELKSKVELTKLEATRTRIEKEGLGTKNKQMPHQIPGKTRHGP